MAKEDTALDLVCCIDEAARDVPPRPNFPAHLAHIVTKTDTRRRRDLVRLVTNTIRGLRP